MEKNYTLLVKEGPVSILADIENIKDDVQDFVVSCNGTLYSPYASFKPLGGGQRLYAKYEDIYHGLFNQAVEKFAELHAAFTPAPATAPAPAPATTNEAQLGAALMQALGGVQDPQKQFDALLPLLEKWADNGKFTRKIEVVTPEATRPVKGVVHEVFEKVLKAVSLDIPVFLTGPAGTGKSFICKQVAEALGLEFYFLNSVSQEYKLTGFIDAGGVYHDTPFFKAFTQGGVFLLDEMDASLPDVLTLLNNAIANKVFTFPTGQVEAHPDFRVVAAGNTYGTGADVEYCGRYQLDAATLDRFIILEVGYSEAIEKTITDDNALIEFFHDFRRAVNTAGIHHLATYRSMASIQKLAGVLPLAEVLKACLLKQLGPDDMNVIYGALKDPANKYAEAMQEVIKNATN